MKTLALIVFIYTIWQKQSPVDSAEAKDSIWPKPGECGRLIKEELYSADSVAQPIEYPWLAQVVFRKVKNNVLFSRCGAVLISKRHLLAIGHCLTNKDDEHERIGILLGKWRLPWFSDDFVNLANLTAPDCEGAELCTPPSQMYEIDEIAINPNYHSNIAVIGLTKDVTFSDYIQPICLPPELPGKGDDDFVAQFLYIGGFDIQFRHKIKTVAQIRNFVDCTNQRDQKTAKVRDQHYTGKFVCASCNFQAVNVLFGSALMGVAVADSEPQYFYLVGLMSVTAEDCSHKYPDMYLKVSPLLKFIQDNAV